eukprot:jgi/Galph1/2207/GphlegSOOS_G903.1
MSSTTEDDTVIAELPITLHVTPEEVFLLQYPLEPKVRVKEIQKKFQLELVPEDSLKTRLDQEQSDKGFRSSLLLESSSFSQRANYVVANCTKEGLVLRPLSRVVQLRPCFSVADSSSEADSPAPVQETIGKSVDDSTTEEEPEVIGVQFRRRETAKTAAWRRNSFAYQNMLRNEEPWKDLKYIGRVDVWQRIENFGNKESLQMKEQMILDSVMKEPLSLRCFDELLRTAGLLMVDNKDASNGKFFGDVSQSVQNLLKELRVVALESLVATVGPDLSVSSILTALIENAVLVRNVWVLKSELITPLSKIEQCCRDIILEAFHSCSGALKTTSVIEKLPGIGPQIWRKILEEIGIHYKGEGWKLKAQGDDTCYKIILPLLKSQEEDLKRRLEKSQQYLQFGRMDPMTDKSLATLKNRSNNRIEEFAANSGLSHEHLKRWLFDFVKRNGTVSSRMIVSQACEDFSWMFSSKEEETSYMQTVLNILNEMCIDVNGIFILKHLNNPSVDEYRRMYTFLYQSDWVLNKSQGVILQLFAEQPKLKRSKIQRTLEERFGAEISNTMYRSDLATEGTSIINKIASWKMVSSTKIFFWMQASFTTEWNQLGVEPVAYVNDIEKRVEQFLKREHWTSNPIVLVTSGGTIAPLEQRLVRYIDNFSTGNRGARSAEYFLDYGCYVIFLHRKHSSCPYSRLFPKDAEQLVDCFPLDSHQPLHSNDNNLLVALRKLSEAIKRRQLLFLSFHTIKEYLYALRTVALALKPFKQRVIIFLAAAVSDFYIPEELLPEHKISSHIKDGKLQLTLSPVPKCLGTLRNVWAPQSFLVSFKLETDNHILLNKAQTAVDEYGVDVVVANELSSRYDRVQLVQKQQSNTLLATNTQPIEQVIVEAILRLHQKKYSSFG